MARRAVPLWKSLPAAVLNDRRVRLPNSPRSRPVLRLALLVLLLLVLILVTGLKMWTNGSLKTQAIVRIQHWDQELKASLRNGTTTCPCAQPAIPWCKIAQWKEGARQFWADYHFGFDMDQGAFIRETAFAAQQCRHIMNTNDVTHVVNKSVVLPLALCMAVNSTDGCLSAYGLNFMNYQLCYSFLLLYAHQLGLPGPQQRTFSSAFLVAEDVLQSALQEFTGTLMRDSMEVSISMNLLVRKIASNVNAFNAKDMRNRTIFKNDDLVTTKDLQSFQKFQFPTLLNFIGNNTFTNWTAYKSICSPTYCTVIKQKGLHNYVLEILALVGGNLSLLLVLVKTLWSAIVFVNVRVGNFEDIVEDDSSEDCNTEPQVPLREKYQAKG